MSINRLNRFLIYMIGIVILAAGITSNTKTALGVSPVISLAFNAATIADVSIGMGDFPLLFVLDFGTILTS
ncbi:hypothetical protein [Streptococcus dysgalactiae]|uniref:hypothetical protein n=1 Tax=Streptococcus dysgalactiae TaxID=1334 RepID=UPI0015F1A25A|nr:hypothetical protein [Streptococcus dysgalactiae]